MIGSDRLLAERIDPVSPKPRPSGGCETSPPTGWWAFFGAGAAVTVQHMRATAGMSEALSALSRELPRPHVPSNRGESAEVRQLSSVPRQ